MNNYKVGDKIKFQEEKHRYTIQACDSRYLVCTKPMNLYHTVLYTIVDLQEGIRGRNNQVFNSYHYKTREGCEECLNDLNSGEVKISFRNRIWLNRE